MLLDFFRIKQSFFFFNDTATTEIYTLSLHDALPIYFQRQRRTLHLEGIKNFRQVTAREFDVHHGADTLHDLAFYQVFLSHFLLQ